MAPLSLRDQLLAVFNNAIDITQHAKLPDELAIAHAPKYHAVRELPVPREKADIIIPENCDSLNTDDTTPLKWVIGGLEDVDELSGEWMLRAYLVNKHMLIKIPGFKDWYYVPIDDVVSEVLLTTQQAFWLTRPHKNE